jgi:MoaA/NifB/PqqE/SkfB family radical SAM enzyme
VTEPWLHPRTGRPIRRLELHITYTCPEACTFCSEEHRMRDFRAFPVTFGRAARVLREQAARGVQAVHLTGGEPTIHPQFVAILAVAKRLGMRTSIGTIGTRLADPVFAAEVGNLLDEALFSLHGPTAVVHDAQTRRAGSFDRLVAAVRNCSKHRGFRPFFNTVVTRENVAFLPETAGLAASLGGSLLVVSNVTPEGRGEDEYRTLTVRLRDIARVAGPTVAAAGAMVVRFFGVPACILGDHRMLANDLHWEPRVTVEWAREAERVVLQPIHSWAPDRRREQPATCGACEWRGMCGGVFSRYVAEFGAAELRPFERAA